MILVPVKDLTRAKQRLEAVLDQPARTQLACAMLQDVLDALASWRAHPLVSVVSSDPFACEQAAARGFAVIPDNVNESETAAIDMATEFCRQRGAEFTLVIPADIPLVRAEELANVMGAAPDKGSVLVPAADGRGTNAILRRPPALFPLRFGNDSFKPHVAAARATQTECLVLSFPGIGLDVDNPADLAQLAAAPGETRSQRLVRGWRLDLPLAANE